MRIASLKHPRNRVYRERSDGLRNGRRCHRQLKNSRARSARLIRTRSSLCRLCTNPFEQDR